MALTIGGIACNNSSNPKTKTENKMEQKEPNVAKCSFAHSRQMGEKPFKK